MTQSTEKANLQLFMQVEEPTSQRDRSFVLDMQHSFAQEEVSPPKPNLTTHQRSGGDQSLMIDSSEEKRIITTEHHLSGGRLTLRSIN